MHNFTKSFLLFVIVAMTGTLSFAGRAVNIESILAKGTESTVTGGFLKENQSMIVKDFLNLTPKNIKENTGEKLSLKERLVLRYAQSKIKREMKKGHVAHDTKLDLDEIVAEGGISVMAVAGFVCSLAGIFIAGLFLGTLGVLFSTIALYQMDRIGKRGSGLAIAGQIIGIIAIAGAALILLGVIKV